PVDVGYGDAGLPAVGIGDAGPVGDVLEPIISLVHVQSVGSDVRGEVEVGQAVVVDVTHGYSATVVVVHVGEDVERGIVGQPVGERDAGAARRQELEQLRLAGAAAAGERQSREEGQNQTRNAERGTRNSAPKPLPSSAFRLPRSHLPYRAGLIRIACPPPGASTRCRREVASTERWEIVTGSGFVSQFAPGPSA